MTAPPAGALEACLALLEKATPGPWVCATSFRGVYSQHPSPGPVQVFRAPENYEWPKQWDANADAIAAAVNLLRDHGPALLAALRLREWRPISTGPNGSDEVVLLCDANGNRCADCWPGLPVNGCGYPAVAYMPTPAPPTADDLARVLEEGE